MAGVLQYALELETGGFNNPLRQSESGLNRFDQAATAGSSKLAGFAAAAGGATAAVGLLAAITAAATANLRAYAEYDGLVRGLKTLEGTADATEQRLAKLRETAKSPGLGFEEAVRGDIRLRSVGISADLSERSLRAFGNAIATVGGGKSDLDGVILALGQMESKGKIAAEEINQINERVPQVRAAMKEAFGTADAEALGKAGLTSTEFIEGLVAALEKVPQVTSGAQNVLDNYDDSWKTLKNTANEFAVGLSGPWLNTVSQVFNTASKDLKRLQEFFGIKTPGLQGPDGATEEQRAAEKAAEQQAAAAQAAADAEYAAGEKNAAFWQQKEEERTAFLKEESARREEETKRNLEQIRRLGEAHAEAVLSEESFLQQKLQQLRANGAATPADVAALPAGSNQQVEAAKNVSEIARLESQITALKERNAAADEAKAQAAQRQATAAAKELTSQQLASQLFDQENQVLSALLAGNDKLAASLERQMKVERLKLSLMREQGLEEAQAAAAAEKRVALEERATRGRRRGILSAAASAASQVERQRTAPARPNSNTDRLALADLERRAARVRPLSPARAAEALARGGDAADPGRDRREERREAKQNAADPLLKAVREIKDQFADLASA